MSQFRKTIFDDCINYCYCCDEPRRKNKLEKIRWEEEPIVTDIDKTEKLFRYTKQKEGNKLTYFWKQSQMEQMKAKNIKKFIIIKNIN